MGKERGHEGQLEPDVISEYTVTFVNRRDLFPIQRDNGTYVSVHRPLTDEIIAAHLKGYITIGAYALDKNGWAKWLCFDADDEKRWNSLLRLSRQLEEDSVIPYLEPSRRGGHLWLFTPTIPGFQIRRFGKQLLEEHKIKGVELYPKQDKPVTGPGSCVRLPLGVHKLTGKRYHFTTLTGEPLAPTIREQIQHLANPKRVPQTYIDNVLKRAPEAKIVSPTPRFNLKPDTDGPISERVKNRISVYDFVSEYVELDSRGKGICPFHDDQVKSFQVSEDGNYWHCYAGCKGQTIIDFWMLWREAHNQKGDFKSILKDLAKMLL